MKKKDTIMTNASASSLSEIIRNWSLSLGEGAPELAVSPTVSRETSGAYEITTISFGFSGDAPYGEQPFSSSFSFVVDATSNLVSVDVSSDDNATVNISVPCENEETGTFASADLSVSSRLYSPNSGSVGQWIQKPLGVVNVSGTHNTIGGPYSLSVKITLTRSLRKLYLGFLYAPPNSKTPGLTAEYPISSRRKIGVGEPVKVWVRSLENVAINTEGLVSLAIDFPSGRKMTIIASGGSSLEIPGYIFTEKGMSNIVATFADGQQLKEALDVVYPTHQVGTEIEGDFRDFFEMETENEETGKKTTVSAIEGQTRKYKVQVYPLDVSFAGVCFWECSGERVATGIFAQLTGTNHVPARELMNLGAENDWIDTVGFGIFEFPLGYFFSDAYLGKGNGESLGQLIWRIPVKWTVIHTIEDKKELEAMENDDRASIGTIIPYSMQMVVCTKAEETETGPTEVSQGGVGVEISVSKNFYPETGT